jgi:hypothetical protein
MTLRIIISLTTTNDGIVGPSLTSRPIGLSTLHGIDFERVHTRVPLAIGSMMDKETLPTEWGEHPIAHSLKMGAKYLMNYKQPHRNLAEDSGLPPSRADGDFKKEQNAPR